MAIPRSSIKKRGEVFYLRYSENGVHKRISLHTDSLQVAKERQRQFDSARARGEQDLFPTMTPLASAVEAYAAHMKATRTRHGYTADLSYLRNAFGPICDVLKPRRRSNRTPQDIADMQRHDPVIRAANLEHVTTAQVSDFIRDHVRRYGLQAKTANRYREVLRRLFIWSIEEGGVRMPRDINPAAKVKRYKERALEIRFLTLRQIDQQLEILQDQPVIHAMVATYIYAGLRREESIWLTTDLPWSCLDYRHTFGSQLAMKGESLYKISALMGNSPEICRRHYATLMPEALVQSVEFDKEFAE